jgi:signal transduction histidine kinase
VDEYRLDTKNPVALSKYKESSRRITEHQKELIERWKAAGLNISGLNEFATTVDLILQSTDAVFATHATKDQSTQGYMRFLQNSTRMYDGAVQIVRELNKEISQQKLSVSTNANTHHLLLLAIALNVALGIGVAYLVRRGVTRPIAVLADKCNALLTAEIIERPAEVTNEIGELERTFHQLSLMEHQNEIARKSYLQHLQDVQTAAVSSSRKKISEIFASSSLTENARAQLEKMSRNLNGMLLLLQQMADAINFNLNKPPDLFVSPVSTKTLIQQSAGSVDWLLKRKNIALKTNDADIQLEADAALLERVLANLLSNAIKFSKSGGVVTLATIAEPAAVRFEITDNGPGISEEDQKKLFRKFSQVGADDDAKRGGSGLGLMISRQIIDAHGGEIGCRSEIAKGSTFWFTVPLSQNASSETRTASTNEATRALPLNKEPKTSITNKFIALFAIFIIGQAGIAFMMSQNLESAQKTSANYAREKTVIVQTQELLTSFISWRQKVADALAQRKVMSMMLLITQLDDLITTSDKLADDVSYSPTLSRLIAEINGQLKSISKVARSVDYSDPSKAAIYSGALAQADLSAQAVEDALFAAIAHEGKEVNSSYDLAVKVRQELLTMLVIAIAFNLVILAATTFVGRGIINRISKLNEKARSFALGKTPVAARGGNDELDRLDRSLCGAAETLRASEAQRINLMAMINHDLRTPLSSLLIGLEMITEGVSGTLPDQEEQLAFDVERRLRKLLSQINDLLDVEKFAAGEADCQLITTKPAALLPLIIEKIRRDNSLAMTKFDLQIEESASSVSAKLDEELFERLMSSLISNALNASPKDSPIKVSASTLNNTLKITVEDKGPGIPKALQPILFDRFRFVDGKPLAGLGLPLASYISSSMTLRLTFNTGENAGTSFNLLMTFSA